MVDRLTTRQLNRATLARQLLLERADCSAEQVLQHLVGMQSQAPLAPYVGLWTRVVNFRADELSALMIERRAVRASLMRATIHLVIAADFLDLWPVLAPVSERGLWTGSPFGRRVPREIVDDLLAFAQNLLAEAPRTRAELRRLLGQRWPKLDADAMAYAAQYLLPIVQVTPRGVWGGGPRRRPGPMRNPGSVAGCRPARPLMTSYYAISAPSARRRSRTCRSGRASPA